MDSNQQPKRRSLEWLPEGHRAQRIKQIIFAVEAVVLLLLAFDLLFGKTRADTLVLGVSAIALMGLIAILKRGHVWVAAYLAVGMMTLLCSMFMYRNAGIRDTSLLGFTAIMYFTTVLGDRHLFNIFLTYTILFLAIIGIQDIYGWREFSGPPIQWNHLADVIILTLLVAFIMKLISGDLRRMLRSMNEENRNALQAREHAVHLSQHDGLTGLPNRVLGEDRFNHAMARCDREGGKVGVLFVDIDHFKAFNDSLGHAVGDALICEIGNRIKSSVREYDSVCRYGGDEFIVILESLPSREWAEGCAEKILAIITQPIVLHGHQLEVTVSIGIAIAPDDGLEYNNICRKADIAMYKAKDLGRNTARYYDEEMNRESEHQMQLINGLRQAVRNSEFHLYYQPQIDLASGDIIGAEALIRWHRGDGQCLLPGEFIATAEETRLIRDIGRWVLREACMACKQWHAAGYDHLIVAVNVSAVQMSRGELERDVRDALSESGLAPRFLQLELTESTLIDNEDSVRAELLRIYHLGVTLAIDDFGTGYSNLAYLSRLKTASIKIDKSFVGSAHEIKENESIIQAIVQLADSLGLSTTAEGLEDSQSTRLIRELGCKVGQGFYWARPMAQQNFLEYLGGKHKDRVVSLFPGVTQQNPQS